MQYKDLSNADKLQVWLDYTPNNEDMAKTRRRAIRQFRAAIKNGE